MFIVFGKKLVYRKLGYVADFCPVCRAKRAFELKRVGSASHVYYISAGDGELVGFERNCVECGTSLRADPNIYASVSKTSDSLEALTARTFPSYEVILHERLQLEERLKNEPSSMSTEERHSLIREAFLLLSPKVEKRFASTHIDKEVALCLVGLLVLLFVGPLALHGLFPDSEGTLILVFFGLGLALVAWQGLQSGRRFMRREVLPKLAKSLQPLRPSDNEIHVIQTELKQLGHKIGSRLVLRDLKAISPTYASEIEFK